MMPGNQIDGRGTRNDGRLDLGQRTEEAMGAEERSR